MEKSKFDLRKEKVLLGDKEKNIKQEPEIYEYTPNNLSSNSSFTNYENDEELLGDISNYVRQRRSVHAEIEDNSLDASRAYERFRGKSYKSSNYDNGFIVNAHLRQKSSIGANLKNEFEVMPSFVLSTRHMVNNDFSMKSNEAFKKRMASVVDIDLADKSADDLATAFLMAKGEAIRQFETPLGRLYRLQNELEELSDFVNSFAQDEERKEIERAEEREALKVSKNNLLFGRNATELTKEINILKSQITALSNDPCIQKFFANVDPITSKKSCYKLVINHLNSTIQKNFQTKNSLADKENDINQSVTNEYEKKVEVEKKEVEKKEIDKEELEVEEEFELKDTDKRIIIDKKKDKEEKECISYELYTVPSMKPLLQTCRLSLLERRLNEIENKIGVNKMFLLPFADIQTGLAELSEKLNILDSQKIDYIGKRAQSIMGELQNLQIKKRETMGVSSDDRKIEDLYDICEKWKKTTIILPIILKRLKTLKALHTQAGGIAMRLNVLENQQQDLARMLDEMKSHFDGLKVMASDNLLWAKQTVEEFKSRLDDIKQLKES